jgi:aryl-alcohol dehydrogenase-like predicted oxidoreductase
MALGLGTAALGRPQYINIKQENDGQTQNLEAFKKQGISALEKAYELGVRYFDTAPGYGLAEQLLIDWLQTKKDASLTVGTKWGYTYIADFDPNAKIHEIKEHSLDKLNEQWNVSKVLLPHLKIYQIHSATLETGVLDNLRILNRLAFLKNEYGLQIGITTTGVNQVEVIKKALDVSVEGKSLFDAFQVTYNVLDQNLNTISKELIQQNKKIIIKEALANGRLFRNEKYAHYNKLYTALDTLAKKYNAKVDSILLNFCEQTIPESIVLSGASNIVHLTSNMNMNDFKLSVDDLEKIAAFKIDATTYWQERKQLNWN